MVEIEDDAGTWRRSERLTMISVLASKAIRDLALSREAQDAFERISFIAAARADFLEDNRVQILKGNQ